jgi:ATP-dependent exoDNAse (exonuclease V) alpha subunit
MTFRTTAEGVRSKLVSDWWEAWEKGPAVMLASRRDDVDDLNTRARLLMRETGRLGEKELVVAGRNFAVGDRVMTTRNAARRLGVLNGTQGEIAAVDTRRGELKLRTDGGLDVVLPRTYLQSGHLIHAYAMTGHKAQGMTTVRCFALGNDTLYREWGYTALSRGKKENRLYLAGGHDPGREEVGGAVSYEADGTTQAIRSQGEDVGFGREGVAATPTEQVDDARRTPTFLGNNGKSRKPGSTVAGCHLFLPQDPR